MIFLDFGHGTLVAAPWKPFLDQAVWKSILTNGKLLYPQLACGWNTSAASTASPDYANFEAVINLAASMGRLCWQPT